MTGLSQYLPTTQDTRMLCAALDAERILVCAALLPMPSKTLSANFRGHTRTQATAKRVYRADCATAIREALGREGVPPDTPLAVRIRCGTKPHTVMGRRDGCYRPMDEANVHGAVGKVAQDALQDVTGINDRYYKDAGASLDPELYGVAFFIAWKAPAAQDAPGRDTDE